MPFKAAAQRHYLNELSPSKGRNKIRKAEVGDPERSSVIFVGGLLLSSYSARRRAEEQFDGDALCQASIVSGRGSTHTRRRNQSGSAVPITGGAVER